MSTSHGLILPPAAAQAAVALMKGVVYNDRDPKLWNTVVNYRTAIREYLRVLGLEVFVDESEGFAFLRQIAADQQELPEDERIPALVPRRAMSYPLTVLCVLLRKKLLEADSGGGSPRVILEGEEIRELMMVFLPKRANEAKTVEELNSLIEKAADFGFLRKLSGDGGRFEIRRVIKALFTADWLAAIDQKLMEYQAYGSTTA